MATQNSQAKDGVFFTDTVTKREQTTECVSENGSIGDNDETVKGMIPYPCCPKEAVMVYSNTHGQASAKCPKCGKYARFDYDRMQARPVRPVRGASRQYKAIYI